MLSCCPPLGHFLRARRPSAGESSIQSCCRGNWPQGGSACLRPYAGYGGQSLRESPVPGLPLTVEHARRNTEGLCPIPSSFLTPCPGHVPVPATPLCRLLSSQAGRSRGRELEAGTQGAFPTLFQPGRHVLWVQQV